MAIVVRDEDAADLVNFSAKFLHPSPVNSREFQINFLRGGRHSSMKGFIAYRIASHIIKMSFYYPSKCTLLYISNKGMCLVYLHLSQFVHLYIQMDKISKMFPSRALFSTLNYLPSHPHPGKNFSPSASHS